MHDNDDDDDDKDDDEEDDDDEEEVDNDGPVDEEGKVPLDELRALEFWIWWFVVATAEAGVEAMPVPELNFSSLVFSMSASRSIMRSPIPMSHSLSSYSKLLVAFVAVGSSSPACAATVLAF